MLPNPVIREVSMFDYLKIFRKRIGLILLFLIILPIMTAVYDYRQKPLYLSTLSLLIEQKRSNVTEFQNAYQYANIVDKDYIRSQMQVLSSRVLAEKVFDDLKLSKESDFKDIKGDAIFNLKNKIKIDSVRGSNIVLVSVEDTDSLRAAAIANAIAKVYIQQDIDVRNSSVREAAGWLESQLGDIKGKVQASEEALNKYQRANKIVIDPDLSRKTESVLEELKTKRLSLSAELSDASKRYKAKHPKMISLAGRLEEVDSEINKEEASLMDLNQKMVQYNLLKNEVDTNRQLYTSILTRAKETGVDQKLESSNIRVIDSARPAEKPYKPKLLRDILVSIIVAFACGAGLSVFIEYLDSSVRTAEDVSSYLNLPFLGYIPSIGKVAKTDKEKALICLQKINDPVIESFRALRTAILFSTPEDKPLRSILVTSSVPGEGKSFIAINLAEIFVQVNERVVIIDADMRRPMQHKFLQIDQKPGLSTFLTGNASLDSIIRPTGVTNLSIITAGSVPPNPSELLSSGKIRSLVEELKLRFDRIIVDSPPTINIADTPLLANIIDGVVLIIKGASTRLEVVIGSRERILGSKGKIIGVAINNVLPEKEDRYYYYHYYYSEDKDKAKSSQKKV
ncbi:MAG: polysaccharide biosynthesis tyrosine autokinase [Candidatus Omnitrophica bacterium]|nr:polysaccharide biosynthesis tyrosine autokinase [Candidatus Omnitrophota bacterium]